MLYVNCNLTTWKHAATLIKPSGRAIAVVNYVDDHWMLDIPPHGKNMAPIVTYEGAEQDAERVMAPVIEALRAGDPDTAFRVAKDIETAQEETPVPIP